MNVHCGTLLLVPQWQCISSFVFYITDDGILHTWYNGILFRLYPSASCHCPISACTVCLSLDWLPRITRSRCPNNIVRWFPRVKGCFENHDTLLLADQECSQCFELFLSLISSLHSSHSNIRLKMIFLSYEYHITMHEMSERFRKRYSSTNLSHLTWCFSQRTCALFHLLWQPWPDFYRPISRSRLCLLSASSLLNRLRSKRLNNVSSCIAWLQCQLLQTDRICAIVPF